MKASVLIAQIKEVERLQIWALQSHVSITRAKELHAEKAILIDKLAAIKPEVPKSGLIDWFKRGFIIKR